LAAAAISSGRGDGPSLSGMMISPGCMRRGPYSVRLPVLDGLAARALQSGIWTVV
jgi:hypothetical protein